MKKRYCAAVCAAGLLMGAMPASAKDYIVACTLSETISYYKVSMDDDKRNKLCCEIEQGCSNDASDSNANSRDTAASTSAGTSSNELSQQSEYASYLVNLAAKRVKNDSLLSSFGELFSAGKNMLNNGSLCERINDISNGNSTSDSNHYQFLNTLDFQPFNPQNVSGISNRVSCESDTGLFKIWEIPS